MNILYVGHRDNNHSKYGGYDYIAKHPNTTYLKDTDAPFGFIPLFKPFKNLNLLFLDLAAKRQKNVFDIIHFFYGDYMFFSPPPANSRAKFVSTIHLKTSSMQTYKINMLKHYAGVVCLSRSEEQELVNLGINACFIPHGFNFPIFNKLSPEKLDINNEKINIFYSGTNYRDFDTLKNILLYCTEKKYDYVFHVLGQTEVNKQVLKNYHNAVIYPRVDDDIYYSLLAECDYNFLPLTFATANNAMLESQALGITSIIPKISGITDYSDPDNNIFYSNNDELFTIFDNLKKKSICKNLADYAKKFEWSNIYKLLDNFYSSLL